MTRRILAHSLIMDILLLLFLLVILALPTILMSRRQRAKMAEIQKLQDALQPGDRVVTTAGLHAIVISVSEELVDLEIAPGVVTSWEKMSVVRVVAPAAGSTPAVDQTSDPADNITNTTNPAFDQGTWNPDLGHNDGPRTHPQSHPENFGDNDGDDRPSGAPETR